MKICWVIAVLFMLIMVFCLVCFLLAETMKSSSVDSALAKVTPYKELKYYSFTEYYSGKKKMLAKVEKLVIKPKKIGFLKIPFFNQGHMVKPDIFLYEGNEWVSRITSDYATMDIYGRYIMFRQKVELSTADGQRLYANNMIFTLEKGIISIKEKFTLNIKGESIKGIGLISDVELKKFTK